MIIILLWICNPIFPQGADSVYQRNDTTYKYWMTGGIMLQSKDASVNVSYNFSINDFFYKVGYRAVGGAPLQRFGSLEREFNTFDISIGRRTISDWVFAAFFIGPCFIYGDKLVDHDIKNFNTIGLQVDAQLLFRLANEIGIGLGLFGNLNFERAYAGIGLNVTIGNGK
jgi:hypothetical protein